MDIPIYVLFFRYMKRNLFSTDYCIYKCFFKVLHICCFCSKSIMRWVGFCVLFQGCHERLMSIGFFSQKHLILSPICNYGVKGWFRSKEIADVRRKSGSSGRNKGHFLIWWVSGRIDHFLCQRLKCTNTRECSLIQCNPIKSNK